MIALGFYDADVQEQEVASYITRANQLTGVATAGIQEFADKFRGDKDEEWIPPQRLPVGSDEMNVKDVQTFLKDAGFFPYGKIDGICGYRTTSAIRLFQEYVRTVEGDAGIGHPDGKMGPKSYSHVARWKHNKRKADWTQFSAVKPSPEYTHWMNLLHKIRDTYTTNPNAVLTKVNEFSQSSDTLKPADWDFNPAKIHLVGVRRNEANPGERQFDDLFVLLIQGLVFKFTGSTDPGATENARGAPFLVQGQHRYRFGWHKLSDQNRVYNALKPASSGVLTVRSKDMSLTPEDLAGGLERNNSINIHWGGEGKGTIGKWSEGCQVIVGKSYINHMDKPIDCSTFAAPNYSLLGQTQSGVYQTKGAYTVLGDLVSSFSGDDNILSYMLIYEKDLALNPDLGIAKAGDILTRLATLRS